MDIKSKIKVYYKPEYDLYYFLVQTPTISFFDNTRLPAASDHESQFPEVQCVTSMQIGINISSENMIYHWREAKDIVLDCIQGEVLKNFPEVDFKLVLEVVDSAARVLDEKVAAEWIEGSQNYTPYPSTTAPTEKMRRSLPGVTKLADCPKDECKTRTSIWYVIQHLNDSHEWSREKIADWLDTLDADLTFKVDNDDA